MTTSARVIVLLWIAVLASSVAASGQTAPVTVAADRLRLNTAPCVLDSVDGTPDKLRMQTCSVLTTSAATNLTLQPTGDLVLDPTGVDVLPGTGYTVNLGALSNKYLTLHAAELWVETLVAQNTIATIGGRVIVAPTTTLTRDLSAASYTGSYPTQAATLCVKHNAFQVHVPYVELGSKLVMEASGKFETFVVLDTVTPSASGSGDYCYIVYRNQDNSGTNDWYAGDAVVDTGKVGNGFIDLYSVAGLAHGSQSGPTIVGNVRTSIGYADWAPRWALGNLNGLYGYGATTYGVAFGDPSATNITIDATNGFRIRSGTTNKLTADTSGNLAIVGDLSVGTSGVIRSNATAFTTGTGIWMDYNGGTPRFRVGNPAGNRLSWDGSTLTLVGDGGGVTNINGANIQTGTITATQIAANTITAAKIAAGTITADRLSVGSLSAISANLGSVTGGSININSGTFYVQTNGATYINVLDTNTVNASHLATGSMSMTGSFSSSIDLSSHDIYSVGTIYVGGVNATVLRMSAGAGYACVDGSGQLYSNAGGC